MEMVTMGTKMVRKQVYLTPEQDRRLKEKAKAQQRPEAEVLREALDAGFAQQRDTESVRREAWERQLEFMRARLALDVTQQPRTWTRDDLYEERMARYGKHLPAGQ
jgi:predicted DNA-binding protein